MTLREHVAEMHACLDLVSVDMMAANDRLSHALVDRGDEIEKLVNELIGLDSTYGIYYFSLPDKDLDKFMRVFSQVNDAIKKIHLTTTNPQPLPVEEFQAIDVQSMGIVPVKENIKHLYWTKDKGIITRFTANTLHDFASINNSSTSSGLDVYNPPSGKMYDMTNYGALYLVDTDKVWSPTWSLNYDEVNKCWGRFLEIASSAIPGQAPYDYLFNNAIPEIYGVGVTHGSDTSGDYVKLPDEVYNRILKYTTKTNYHAPADLVEPYRTTMFEKGLRATDSNNQELMMYIESGYAAGTRWFYLNALPVDVGGKPQSIGKLGFTGSTSYQSVTVTEPVHGCVIRRSFTGVTDYYTIGTANISWNTPGTTSGGWQLGAIQDIYMPVPGGVKYDVTRLLDGDFALNLNSRHLDDHMDHFARTQNAIDKADYMLKWLKDVSDHYYPDGLPEAARLEFFRRTFRNEELIMQLSNLYLVKYAIIRILYGHIHRVK